MMRKSAFAAILLVAFAPASAHAALASPYQRAAELTAVIDAAVGVLGIYAIESVQRLNIDQYEVRTLSCTLIVDIVETHVEGEPVTLGLRSFSAVAGEPQCNESFYGLPGNAVWFGDASEYGASLVFGIPNSGYGPIAFSCTPDSLDLTFSYEFEPIDPSDGVRVAVFLSAGDIEVPIETTGTRLQMDDLFVLEGTTRLDERLTDLITSRGTLIVFVEDGAEEYPLDGAREAAAPLIENCFAGPAG